MLVGDGIVVTLSKLEAALAAQIGVYRQIDSITRQGTAGAEKDSYRAWDYHILGAMGEQAVAKAMGWYWEAHTKRFSGGGPNVGSVHVRTRSQDHYDLNIRPQDGDDDVLVLVVHQGELNFRVVGWITGSVAKKQFPLDSGYRKDRSPCHWVPQVHLNNLEQLDDPV